MYILSRRRVNTLKLLAEFFYFFVKLLNLLNDGMPSNSMDNLEYFCC